MSVKAWCVTEDLVGCKHQVQGLAKAMQLEYCQKLVRVHRPWHYCPTGFYPFPHLALKNLDALDPNKCPRYVITCGKKSVYASLYLKKQLGDRVTTIHIQDPKISSASFDFIVAPECR